MQKYIIDVSEHQGRIDWQAVKPHINGVIIRCGYGDDEKSQDDDYWAYNVEQCEKLGIPYGVYLYSYADTDAHIQSEIAHVLRLLKGHKPQYPVYIDLEESSYGSFAVRAADAFCPAIEKAGYTAGVYTFESFYNQFMRGWTKYTLWVAKYGINDGAAHSKPQIGVDYDAWQFTSNARVGGFGDRLDASYFYRDFTDKKQDAAEMSTSGKVTDVLRIARSQLGVTNGAKYGAWYEKNIDRDAYNYDFGGDDVPWCAMFASWVFTQAKVSCAGLPGAYCPSMVSAAEHAGRVIDVRDAVAGDVVYFDWDRDGESDHVGIVTANQTSYQKLLTIEGNTDDGIVAEKQRAYNTVCAVVRPYYGKDPQLDKPIKKLGIGWRISCDKKGKSWLAHNGEGQRGKAMRWLAIANVEKYRVCTKANGWLPWVYKCNRHDLENGCAGDGSPITGIQVTDTDAAYAARVLNRGWYPDMHGLTDTGGSGDNFAGDLANELDGFRIKRI